MIRQNSQRITRTAQLLAALSLLIAACGSAENLTTTDAETVAVADSSSVTEEVTNDSLVRCDTIETPTTTLTGDLGQRNPDELLMGVIFTYSQENPDTFAGVWIDRQSGGVVMVAFTDDPEPHRQALLARGPQETDIATIEPRLPITDPSPIGERDDFVLDVVQLENTEASLRATQDDLSSLLLSDERTGAVGIGSGTRLNRVSIELIDPTDAGLEIVEEAISGLPVCVNITISPTPPSGPLNIIAAPGEPPVYPPGLSVVTWELDPAFPTPGASDIEVHVLATELGCANGREMGDALRGPQVLETETQVIIVFAVEPVVGGADCPGNPSTPVTVELSQPLGDRELVDGGSG